MLLMSLQFQNVVPAAPAAISAALPQQQGGDVPWHLPPFFEDDNGQVHIGHGIVIPSDKWAALMCVPRDSLFCKEGARCLWTAAELKERSVKGQICRRFVNNPDTTAKKPMTPKKLLALNNAFSHFVDRHPENKDPGERKKNLITSLEKCSKT
ncbi:BEN domain-containing protein 5-like [Dermacentor variabilis]|uniref:BEN domain-containing protein 5-like n=1 Tax=Dermacentor variabilis TaxID=34621 RepID=UPI003F5C60CF